MVAPRHTFGPTCALYRPEDPPSEDLEPPIVKAQFFYVSPLPIDDPLSPIPPLPSDSKSAQSKYSPQPFSARDNAALEEAWIGYLRDGAKRHATERTLKEPSSKPLRLLKSKDSGRLEAYSAPPAIIESGLSKDMPIQPQSSRSLEQPHYSPMEPNPRNYSSRNRDSKTAVGRYVDEDRFHREFREGEAEIKTKDNGYFSTTTETPKEPRRSQGSRGRSNDQPDLSKTRAESTVLLGDASSKPEDFDRPVDKVELESSFSFPIDPALNKRRPRSPFREFLHRNKERLRSSSPRSRKPNLSTESQNDHVLPAPGPEDLKTSGRPFARVPSQHSQPGTMFSRSQEGGLLRECTDAEPSNEPLIDEGSRPELDQDISSSRLRGKRPTRSCSNNYNEVPKGFVPVGVSRLHLVEIPDLLMKPIYWNPINDISNVLRATWFYKNTMAPLEPDLANQLEIGYEYMRPWTDTWQDELNSITEIGADAELKVVHRLWPEEGNDRLAVRPGSGAETKASSKAGLSQEDTKLLPKPQYQINTSVGPKANSSKPMKFFKSHSVIYINGTDAQILRPSLLPSSSRGRRPLSAIRKGRQIGVPVVRGFDHDSWEKIHPPKKMNVRNAQAKVGAYLSQSGDAATQELRAKCAACRVDEEKPQVTDLVLVVHGIGQKLSQRVDSFHFTHSINDFRRQVHIELSSEAVQGRLRPEMGGIMVLPINWRLTLSLDEEESKESAQHGPASNDYHLKDITPETLPAVRNLISDVMLDIPYYLSNHKQEMISAVVTEANRVYRLWCRNNPGFHGKGRVHIIAHSLGSAMVMDVLSQQPTKLPKHINPRGRRIEEHFFEFDTKSLFCCGSPAGFFLLLNKANLLPRQDRNKPGAEGEDLEKGIAGEAGTYGCLAVDNVYNVMHYNDPIAYHINATVDTDYAASLKPAQIPNANPGFFASLGSSFNWSDASKDHEQTDGFGGISAMRPHIHKLPTTIEMNTHNFSREEIAEKRMFLLNDNGQVDYFLSSGGGPLEIQYLSMLSAHSSYWTLQDFIRFVVLEVGRRPGRAGTLPFLRAEKKRSFKAGKIA